MKLIACPECKRQWDVSRYNVGQKLRCLCNTVLVVPRQRSFAPEVQHCAACGAPRAPESMKPCSYCGAVPSPDAASLSLVCPFCLRRTPKGSRFCSSCGKAIQPGNLDVKAGKLLCPRCRRVKLVNRKVGDFAVDECPGCSGMWVQAGAFERIVNQQAKRQETELRSAGNEARPVRSSVKADSVVYLKCPVCGRFMNRRNFAGASGVIIDECRNDGVWLDCDELGKIAAFVASGGLSYARRLQSSEKPSPPRAHAPSVPAMSSFAPVENPQWGNTPFDLLVGLIRSSLWG